MKKAWIIALNTFHESLRKKTFYILLVVALVVIGASRFFSFLAAEDELKMIKDVSFSTIEFFGALIAIFTALAAVSGEIEKRTIYPLLSKPITRSNFIIGKLMGQSLIILLNVILMSIFFIVLLFIKKSPPDIETFKTIFLIFIELVLIGSITLAVATFATDAFNLIFSFFLYIVGHLISYGKSLLERVENVVLKGLGEMLYTVIPNYENFNIKDKVVVGVQVSWQYIGQTFIYGIIYIAIAVLIGIYFFNKREV
ncbi:MAG: ABC transporter permease [Candidatus Omnitrophica bacterium]|nr:ABC transporter permease [Candidatus Omnitrophota bacterium]